MVSICRTNMLRVISASIALLSAVPLLSEESGLQVEALRDVMLPMRDGVKLATDIYLPFKDGQRAAGRFPTVVARTPYNKIYTWAWPVEYWVKRGYVVVSQDVRGRYKSEGHWRMLVDDGQDGYDLLRWIGEQPWSNVR